VEILDRAHRSLSWVSNRRGSTSPGVDGVSARRRRRSPTKGFGTVGLVARAAVRPSFTGSRADLGRSAVLRVDAGLLVIFLGGRAIHLLQAIVDVAVSHSSYTHPTAALVALFACFAESSLVAIVLLAKQRLVMPVLLADAVFGLLGLGLLSYATTMTPGRTGTIDWMLPYTVATAAGLGLLAAQCHFDDTSKTLIRHRHGWLGAPVALLLAVGYAASVSLPRLGPGESVPQVVENACNYPLFYLCTAALSWGLYRRLKVITAADEKASQEAAQLAEQAQLLTMAGDVFGPVLDLLDRATEIADEVPLALREEAARLMCLIDAINPQRGGSV
jgi:hypothetical protein